MNNEQTHCDPVEAGAICHSECAIAEITRLREQLTATRGLLDEAAYWLDPGVGNKLRDRIVTFLGRAPRGMHDRDIWLGRAPLWSPKE